MVSGNFLIGDGLSIKGFKKYVQPLLKDKGYSVQDILIIDNDSQSNILVSIIGKGDLEKEINDVLVKSGEIMEKDLVQRQPLVAYQHQVSGFDESIAKGRYETIGIYAINDGASQLFPSIAQKYLLETADKKAYEVAQEIKSLLEKKLSDL